MDDNPPAYQETSAGEAVGQLIDLGTEISTEPPQPHADRLPGSDIVDQLADLGVCVCVCPSICCHGLICV